MAKFRKKAVVIEATQWHKLGDHPKVESMDGESEMGWCPTLEGGHIVTPGDWIITGVKGENYPCKPDIFEETYEPAETLPGENSGDPGPLKTAWTWEEALEDGETVTSGPIDTWRWGSVMERVFKHGNRHYAVTWREQAEHGIEDTEGPTPDVCEVKAELKQVVTWVAAS